MNAEGQNWFNGLKRFAGECRAKRPVVSRDDLTVAEEMQCRIIGGSLIAWLQNYGPLLIQERAMLLAPYKDMEKDPFIVFTSEQPGLAAGREILGEDHATIVSLYPAEFTEWLLKHPDPEYRWHVHTSSFFTDVDAETAKKAEKYTVSPGETLWLHKEGTVCGELFARGGDHLWKWDGHEPKLLEECVNQWVS